MGGDNLDYYCEIVRNNPRKMASELVSELLDFNQFSEDKLKTEAPVKKVSRPTTVSP
jgi:hypothetical protein